MSLAGLVRVDDELVEGEVSASNPGVVSVLVTDANGDIIKGAEVEFTTDAGRLGETTVSDENGIATAIIYAASHGQSEGTVTASYIDSNGDVVPATLKFITQGDEVIDIPDEEEESDDPQLSLFLSTSPDNSYTCNLRESFTAGTVENPVTNVSPVTVVALLCHKGKRLSNERVNFTSSLGTLSANSSLTAGTGIKQGQAQTTLTVTEGEFGAGTITVDYTTGDGTSIQRSTDFQADNIITKVSLGFLADDGIFTAGAMEIKLPGDNALDNGAA